MRINLALVTQIILVTDNVHKFCCSDPWICQSGSIEEEGLYDHVIYNDNLEEAFQELAALAERALSGDTGAAAPGEPQVSCAGPFRGPPLPRPPPV